MGRNYAFCWERVSEHASGQAQDKYSPEMATATTEAGGVNPCRQKNLYQHTAAIDARPLTCQRRHDMAANNSPEGATATTEAGGVNPCRQKNQYQHTAAIDPKPPHRPAQA